MVFYLMNCSINFHRNNKICIMNRLKQNWRTSQPFFKLPLFLTNKLLRFQQYGDNSGIVTYCKLQELFQVNTYYLHLHTKWIRRLFGVAACFTFDVTCKYVQVDCYVLSVYCWFRQCSQLVTQLVMLRDWPIKLQPTNPSRQCANT